MNISFSKPFKDIFRNTKALITFCITCFLVYNNMALNYFTKHYFASLKSGQAGDFWFMPIVIIVSFLLSLVFTGFILDYMKNEILCVEETFPSFKNNFKYFLKKGVKFSIAILLLWTIFLIVTIIPWMILSKLFFIPNLWNLLLILAMIFCISLTGLFSASYAEKESIEKSFSCFSEIFLAFKYAFLEIFITFFICIFGIILYIIIEGLGVYLNYLLLLSIIFYSLVNIYNPNLWAQTWKCYKENYKEIQDRKTWLNNPD